MVPETELRSCPSADRRRGQSTPSRLRFDIADFSNVSLSNCRILQGDMSSREDLSRLLTLGPFDIVIDDGSHASPHQQIALACLFPHVAPSGFYFIEDLNSQPLALERADVPQTRTLLRRKCFECLRSSPARKQSFSRLMSNRLIRTIFTIWTSAMRLGFSGKPTSLRFSCTPQD
jgi:hypothetical protein